MSQRNCLQGPGTYRTVRLVNAGFEDFHLTLGQEQAPEQYTPAEMAAMVECFTKNPDCYLAVAFSFYGLPFDHDTTTGFEEFDHRISTRMEEISKSEYRCIQSISVVPKTTRLAGGSIHLEHAQLIAKLGDGSTVEMNDCLPVQLTPDGSVTFSGASFRRNS